jgi:hypothetical protein
MRDAMNTVTGHERPQRPDSHQPESHQPPRAPSSLLAVLGQEFKELHHGAPLDDSSLTALYQSIHKLEASGAAPRAALCLSGGGIRSASFGLGIIQGLAEHGLLLEFHYLSTVSGGGYIGSWLAAWRRYAADDKLVIEKLKSRQADPPDEPREIGSLRSDSNFLTPRLGPLSADTWTAVALYVRNLLLNWLVLVPVFAAVLLIPLIASRFLDWASCSSSPWRWATFGLGVLLLIAGHTRAIASRPGEGRRGIDEAHFLLFILLPIYGGATFLSIFAAQGAGRLVGCAAAADSSIPWFLAAAVGAGAYACSWLLGFAARRRQTLRAGVSSPTAADPLPPWVRFCIWMGVGALVGWVIWLGLDLWVENPAQNISWLWIQHRGIARDAIAVFGVAWIVLSLMVGEMLYIGLISYARNGDADREWLARAAGWTVAVTLLWLCLSGLVLLGPLAVQSLFRWLVPLLGGVSGILGALIGFSSRTAATLADKGKGSLTGQIARLAAVVFLLSLALLLSMILVPPIDQWGRALQPEQNGQPSPGPFILALGAAIGLGALSLGASWAVNVNRFSLHAVYRNRLVRAYLGAARASQHRNPDAFTGFDLDDNIRMHKLWRPGPGIAARLFHVVNITLNVVHSTNLAWQQRKAETFTMTPLATGNPYVGYRPSLAYGGPRGVTLGTAMAISGAAASPNMGYHTSPLIGLMMTLFNLRLGWWFGNPNHASTWKREGPLFGISAILHELLGLTDDVSPHVYLSDGGHFENLGLYEMVRRRCRYILVSDAGSDPDCALADLGNAIRKIWIDFGIGIEFPCFNIKPRAGLAEGAPPPGGQNEACYCAVGRITYPEPDAPSGYLLYVKPTLYGREPVDILSYAAENPTFPSESTSDQWFSESQLESYRALGSYIVERLCENMRPAAPDKALANLVDRACDHARLGKEQKDELLGVKG